MAQAKPAASKTWLESLPGKITKLTAILVACIALANGAHDLYAVVAKLPIGQREKLNEELFHTNFNSKPIVDQPMEIATADMKLSLLLQVYPTGDLFVRYGKFEQWLPFKSVKVASFSIIPEANAQLPLPQREPIAATVSVQQNSSIYIDLDKLRTEQTRASTDAVLTHATEIEKNYLLAEMKDDHPYLLERSIREFTKTFNAEPGYRISTFNFQIASANHYTPGKIKIVDNGSAVVVTFQLKSGAALDRYRGWIQGTLKTQQQRIR
jgi:hypothetical protein